jgi:hypothetical protein
MFLLGFTGPIDRIKLLKPVVLVPVPSGSFDHQLGDPTDIGSQEFSNMIVVNCKENDGIDTFYHRKMNNEVMIPPAGNS